MKDKKKKPLYQREAFQEREKARRERLNAQYNQGLWNVTSLELGDGEDIWDAAEREWGDNPLYETWLREQGYDPRTGERFTGAVARLNDRINDGALYGGPGAGQAGQGGGAGQGGSGSGSGGGHGGGAGGGNGGGNGGGANQGPRIPVPGAGQSPPRGQTPPRGYNWVPYYGWVKTNTSTPGAPDDPSASPFNQGAFDAMFQLLQGFGLESLGDFLKNLILDGTTDSASLMLALQNTNEWKTRFAGNEMLRQTGLGVLSPAEYLATERSYAQIMKNYGLPAGFYDDPADFAKWIGRSVSAAELQSRVASYSDLANREDPAIVAQLQSMGLSQGDLLAHFMDPDRAAPLIQRQYQTALLGGAARRSGVVADNEYLGKLAGLGISEQQAGQGYGAIGQSLDTAKTLSSVYGVEYGQGDMESEVFENNAASSKKRRRLASQERASFAGQSGQSGIQKNTGGSY